MRFRIRYFDAFNNDVVLTFTNPTLRLVTTQVLSGNLNGVIDRNECNLLNIVMTNVSGAPISLPPRIPENSSFGAS